jgi:hypothetical protein
MTLATAAILAIALAGGLGGALYALSMFNRRN